MKYNKLERQSLMQEHIDYVTIITKKLIKAMNLPQSNYDDYLSAGFIGLAEAAERFDSLNGTTFKQYAFLRIRGSIIDSIRASSTHTGKAYKMAKALQSVNDIRLGELEQELKTENISLEEILDFASRSGVLYQMGMSEADCELSIDKSENPFNILDQKQKLSAIKKLISTLPDKQKIIMEEYYYNDLSFTEISDKYSGMSKSWISRLHDRAIITINKKLLESTTSS